MAKSKFPQTLVVMIDDTEDEPLYLAYPNADELPESEAGEDVAVYELKKVSRLLVTKALQ